MSTVAYQPVQPDDDVPHAATASSPYPQSFLVAKNLMLRGLGAVHVFAFLAAFLQNRALFGSSGLVPVHEHVRRMTSADDKFAGFLGYPCVWWWLRFDDDALDAVALAGLVLSALVCSGVFSSAILLALWLLYFSIVLPAEATSFYQYGWESQLLETTFLAIFLCDLLPWRVQRTSPPSPIALWLLRWLSFRISIGAGLIKLRGDSCWTQRTCLWYHFETQPVPSPTSFGFHFLPKPVLSAAVELDLFVQVYSVWLVLVPGFGALRHLRRIGGCIQALFMINIALSGNLSMLNHLTIIPALACLDDACWPRCLRPRARDDRAPSRNAAPLTSVSSACRALADFALLSTIGFLSWPVVANLLQLHGRQVMNSSFGSFRLVNTYGAFGSVGEARYEPILSVSWDRDAPSSSSSSSSSSSPWVELDFPCKPGNLTRRPCFSAPYHYRLDWNIWFLGFKPHRAMLEQRERWLYALVSKLLTAELTALSLLDASAAEAFRAHTPHRAAALRAPRYAKVDMYRYEMAAPLWELAPRWWRGEAVTWWRRTYEEPLIPPVSVQPGTGQLVLASRREQ